MITNRHISSLHYPFFDSIKVKLYLRLKNYKSGYGSRSGQPRSLLRKDRTSPDLDNHQQPRQHFTSKPSNHTGPARHNGPPLIQVSQKARWLGLPQRSPLTAQADIPVRLSSSSNQSQPCINQTSIYPNQAEPSRPNFTIALIRTPFLPPRFASFYVPLNFNKLDLRDYLQRVYGVGVLSVRSTVEQQKVTRELPNGRYGYGKWRRPRSKKRMTVELKEPFVWPEVPENMEAYVTFFFCLVISFAVRIGV